MRRHSPILHSVAALTAMIALVTLSGCSSASSAAESKPAGSAISADRCAKNKAAGTVTFLTGYQYQASASILEVIAAEKLGYFNDLCMDVKIQAGTGDTATNAKLTAANKVQFTAVSQQDLLTSADNGIDLTGISSYSNAGLEVLMTRPDITDLKQLDGTVLGQKGGLPAPITSMLEKAGANVGSMKQVTVGYDPSILPRKQVDSLTGFISNEPNLLAAAGDKVKVWRPIDYGVPGSLGAFAANPDFAKAHPTVVEDFLRASLHAMDYCGTKAAECVGYAAALAGEGYDVDHNVAIWTSEVGVIHDTKAANLNLGAIDPTNVAAIYQMLTDHHLVKSTFSKEQATALFDGSYVDSLYQAGKLVWPAP